MTVDVLSILQLSISHFRGGTNKNKNKKKMRIQLLTYYQEPQGDQGCVGLGPN